ncbi:MAG: putative sulfate exporter family transporter [Phycisphaerae bacterium]|nr:putative sulfate exporter family transporter [Phycisphaerae bacterium]
MKPWIFLIFAGLCLTPWARAEYALGAGIVLALAGQAAFESHGRKLSRLLIQSSIVALGLTIDLRTVIAAGAQGMAFAAGTIIGVFALGALLRRLLRTDAEVSVLLGAGTAICGGSAIAATGSVIRAAESSMSVALAAVFVLNAAALYVFPPVGHALGLTEHQFGTWAAVAIHDMSSVVAAGKSYGPAALEQATVVKLTRVLWIVPVALAAGWWFARARRADGPAEPSPRLPVPWFVVLFLCASAARTAFPTLTGPAEVIRAAAKTAMCLALFLIGSGLSRAALARIGWRPFAQAVMLWVTVSVAALAVVRATVQ